LFSLETAISVMMLGPPGVGKINPACTITSKTLETRYTVLFVTL